MTSSKALEYRKDFLKCLNSIDYSKHRYNIFQDFLEISAISFSNAVSKNQELENRYLEIIKQYKEPKLFAELLAITAKALGIEPCDFLGEVYMMGEFGNKTKGQVFTPYHVAEMMSLITTNKDSLKKEIEEKGFITVSDPCCGSAVMIIAFANTLLKYGYNPQRVMWFECRDIDITCCYMAYIQTTLLGLSGEVQHGNTITLEIWKRFITPMSVLTYPKFKFDFKNNKQEQPVNTEIRVNRKNGKRKSNKLK